MAASSAQLMLYYSAVLSMKLTVDVVQDKADAMIAHLASLSNEKVIVSFAPKTLAYSILKRIGELFPGPSKATRAYLHKCAISTRALHLICIVTGCLLQYNVLV
jgi:magnesium-protoporphyrin O-methyltransferase